MPVWFDNSDFHFTLRNKKIIRHWINLIISRHHGIEGRIQFIFTSDEYLLQLNQQYLHHKSFTDILTFPDIQGMILSGDIYISLERITANSNKYDVSFEKELHRVMIHGILHLIGFTDKSEMDKKKMTVKEDEALVILDTLLHVPRGTKMKTVPRGTKRI